MTGQRCGFRRSSQFGRVGALSGASDPHQLFPGDSVIAAADHSEANWADAVVSAFEAVGESATPDVTGVLPEHIALHDDVRIAAPSG